jgi:signal transduction histidine kinase
MENALLRKCEELLENLKNEQKRVESIFTIVPVGISIATDETCQEILHNPEAAKIFRVPTWHSLSLSNPRAETDLKIYAGGRILLPEEMPIQRSAWNNEVVQDLELELAWDDGVRKTILMSSRPLYDQEGRIISAFATIKDITHIRSVEKELRQHKLHLEALVKEKTEALRRLEYELIRLDRLEIVGEIAASIGHEVRNPLTTVRGYLQLLSQREDNPVFSVMIEELDRANNIISEFLSIARTQKWQMVPGSLNEIITGLHLLFEANGLMSDKSIVLDLNPTPDILMDAKLIRQLLMNLVQNGYQAMEAGGKVTIRTEEERESIVLSIRDEGHGIPEQYWGKIGSPFFTTKEDGTGLGMSVCYDIATKHGARIDFTSGESGTTFFVRFPKPEITSIRKITDTACRHGRRFFVLLIKFFRRGKCGAGLGKIEYRHAAKRCFGEAIQLERATISKFLAKQKGMDAKSRLLTTIAFIAAPTLLHTKPSALTSFTKSKRNLYYAWERYKTAVTPTLGIRYLELSRTPERILVLFYDADYLGRALCRPENGVFLRSMGYGGGLRVEEALAHLKSRMQQGLPHEIGLFLGYPVDDVREFIRNRGQGYILCRYWKVYHDPDKAQYLFDCYDRAKKQVVDSMSRSGLRLLEKG